ncbi:MAG: hypothetical protein BSOLF_2683 [Candidatus Carbobacillus altaicus]|uniref:Uncharacterized protein n=1 Tax=Candidatus Carbonibacillus altaicus TaxID=2163959 RepID=A0A2R6Y2C7_9BACL|nr:MAG: hypothetical protein BSOLF_2683 [Candidatus Carbobacillus altaicus]
MYASSEQQMILSDDFLRLSVESGGLPETLRVLSGSYSA